MGGVVWVSTWPLDRALSFCRKRHYGKRLCRHVRIVFFPTNWRLSREKRICNCFPIRRDPASFRRARHAVNAGLTEWWISRKWTNMLASKKRRSYCTGSSLMWLRRTLCALKALAAVLEVGIRSLPANQVANHVTQQTNNILDRVDLFRRIQ